MDKKAVKKKILVVSSFDVRRNQSSAIRIVALVEALHNHGHIIHLAYIQANKPIDKMMNIAISNSCEKIIPLVETNVSESASSTPKTTINRLKSFFKTRLIKVYSKVFIYDVFQTRFRSIGRKALRQIDDNYDFIISSSDPRSSHKLYLKKIKKIVPYAKWIQYWGDPMTNDVTSKRLFRFAERYTEKRLISKCDVAIYTNPKCCLYMRKQYPFAADKIFWIPTTDLRNMKSSTTCAEYDISYVGDYISKYRDITPFYNAVKELSFKTIIAGGGDINLVGNNHLHVYGRVDRCTALNIENKSKILVVIDNVKSRNDSCIQIPGKLYHFALTNKYVLFITDSLKTKECYCHTNRFVFTENSTPSIKNTINEIMNGNLEKSFHSTFLDYSQESIAKQFDNITSNIID